jgi:regulator of cell morphogenesis and NO signaling
MTENILDVTVLEPRQKHPAIFIRFNDLKIGESFIIHNDHDPVPLYYQMNAQIPGIFQWDYLERGPETFRVQVTRLQEGALPVDGGRCCG